LPDEEPEKQAFDFDGWYTDYGTYNNKVKNGDVLSTNVTLYANYTPKPTYQVKFVVE
jgi:uncharacterized repeat protein (TIGR02543 family)